MKGLNVPFMDKEFTDRILAVEPKQIDYLLCDILNKKERKAAIDRLKGVQKAIRKRMDAEKKHKAKTGKVNSVFVKNEEGKDNWGEALKDYSARVAKMKERDRNKQKELEKQLNDPDTFKSYTPEMAQRQKKNYEIMIKNLDHQTNNALYEITYFSGNYISK